MAFRDGTRKTGPQDVSGIGDGLAQDAADAAGELAESAQESASPEGVSAAPRSVHALTESWRAEIAAGIAAVIAVAAFYGPWSLGTAVVALIISVSWGWPTLVKIPNRRSASLVIAVVGLSSVAIVALTPDEPILQWIPLLLSGGVLLAFARELTRGDGRPQLVESVTGVITGMVVAVCAVGWLAIDRSQPTYAIEIVGAITLAVCAALSGLPLRGWTGAGVTIGGALVAGLAGGFLMPDMQPLMGLMIGLLIGLVAASVRHLFAHLRTAGTGAALAASIALPATAAGLAVYIIGMLGDVVSL